LVSSETSLVPVTMAMRMPRFRRCTRCSMLVVW
jgi:hypothetical protein